MPSDPTPTARTAGPWTRRAVGLLGLWTALQAAWFGLYILRTSFLYGQERVFVLWDDAMISMQYARNLALGHGLVWNPGEEPVQGFTNLGVTLVMAAVHALPVPSTRISLVVQILAAGLLAAISWLLFAIALRLFAQNLRIAVAAALAAPFLAAFGVWTLQGSDVGFVGCWLLLCVAGLARARDAGRDWSPGLYALLALGPLLRLDATLFAAVLLLASLGLPGRRQLRLLTGAAVLALTLGALLLFGWLYYGDPLPNTYYLKATGSPRALVLANGWRQTLDWLPRLALPLALAALAVWGRRRDALVLACAGVVLAAFAYNLWVGGDWDERYGSRFVVLALPVLLLLAAAGVDDLLAAASALKGWIRGALVAGVTLALALLIGPGAATLEWVGAGGDTMYRLKNNANFVKAIYVQRATDRSASVALHWAGIPGYFSERPAIDVLGKSDRHIARLQVDRFHPGHSKWDWDYVLGERAPDLVLTLSRGLDGREDFIRDYYAVERGHSRGMYLRKQSVHKLHDPEAVLVDLATGEARPAASRP